MAKPAPTLEEQYLVRSAEGPEALLSEKGTDGKRLARFAFDGSHQPFGPYDATEPSALRQVVKALLEQTLGAYGDDLQLRGPSMLVETAKQTARGMHTHSGKYLQAETGSKYLNVAGDAASVYLSSASAAGLRSVTAGFAHAPKQSFPGKLFIANLKMGNRIATVAELLVEDVPAVRSEFLATGLTEPEYEAIRHSFGDALRNADPVIDGFLPQLLWPTDEGDIALTAVPSLAVYNSISAMHAQVSESAYLSRASFAVGSGQAQNISVAASSVAGNLQLLRCTPPRIVRTGLGSHVASAHARQLAARLPREVLDRFFVDASEWPNQARHRFLQMAARRHVALVFIPAWELRDAIEAGELDPADLPDGDSALLQFARGAAVTPDIAQALLAVVLDALPDERKATHTAASWSYYHEQVRTSILNWNA